MRSTVKKKRPVRDRGAEAVAKAEKAIAAAGWIIIQRKASYAPRFVAVRRFTEREDDSTTTLYESDYTVEGLAALVARREREEGRK